MRIGDVLRASLYAKPDSQSTKEIALDGQGKSDPNPGDTAAMDPMWDVGNLFPSGTHQNQRILGGRIGRGNLPQPRLPRSSSSSPSMLGGSGGSFASGRTVGRSTASP